MILMKKNGLVLAESSQLPSCHRCGTQTTHFIPFSKILDSPLLSGYDSRQVFVRQAWRTVSYRWNAKYAVWSLGSWISPVDADRINPDKSWHFSPSRTCKPVKCTSDAVDTFPHPKNVCLENNSAAVLIDGRGCIEMALCGVRTAVFYD